MTTAQSIKEETHFSTLYKSCFLKAKAIKLNAKKNISIPPKLFKENIFSNLPSYSSPQHFCKLSLKGNYIFTLTLNNCTCYILLANL